VQALVCEGALGLVHAERLYPLPRARPPDDDTVARREPFGTLKREHATARRHFLIRHLNGRARRRRLVRTDLDERAA
jgi:hypothetical protein